MRIENLRKESSPFGHRVSATIWWEDRDHPAQTVFFETDPAHAHALAPEPAAFLTAALMPALFHGEKRIAVEGPLCPDLYDGLLTAVGVMARWRQRPSAPTIEPKGGLHAPAPSHSAHPASFLSGGIDSLATLRLNLNRYPPGHPLRIRECLLVRFFGEAPIEQRDDETRGFSNVHKAVSVIAKDAAIGLIPVQTNIRELEPTVEFYMQWYFGSALASVAHAFPARFSVVSLASSHDLDTLRQWGSHPMIDNNCSSSITSFRHDSLRLTRFQKVRAIADWSVALNHMKVCYYPFNKHGTLNCGECEKCVRSLTELIAAGAAMPLDSFPCADITPDDILKAWITRTDLLKFYTDLIESLDARGRNDLAEAIRKRKAWFGAKPQSKLRRSVVGFDDQYLGGTLGKAYRRVRRKPTA